MIWHYEYAVRSVLWSELAAWLQAVGRQRWKLVHLSTDTSRNGAAYVVLERFRWGG